MLSPDCPGLLKAPVVRQNRNRPRQGRQKAFCRNGFCRPFRALEPHSTPGCASLAWGYSLDAAPRRTFNGLYDGRRAFSKPAASGLIDLIKNAAVGEMSRLRFLPAAEYLIDREQVHLREQPAVFGGD